MSIAEPVHASRWSRPRSWRNIRLTKRDQESFKLLSRYRYLRKNYLDAFMGGNPTANKKRYRELFHAGYLKRPAQQRQYYNANYRSMICELDKKGKDYLESRDATQQPMALYKNIYNEFGHLVMLCDVLANIELGARAHGATITPRTDLVRFPCSISKNINGKMHYSSTPVTPDALFAIQFKSGKTLHFALEVDCGTEPLTRSNLEQTSYERKLLQYRYVLEEGTYSDFDIPQLFVLHVTNTEHRMTSIMDLIDKSKSNLFRHMTCLGDFAPDPKPNPDFFGKWLRQGYPEFDFQS